MSTQSIQDSEFFPWDDSYLTGIPSIDSQHMGLFQKVNAFHKAVQEDESLENILKFLGELKDYARSHFTHEEHLMEKHGYPHITKHARLHEQGFMSMLSLTQNTTDPALIGRVLQFAKHWISTHVIQEDRDFINFLVTKAEERPLADLDIPPSS